MDLLARFAVYSAFDLDLDRNFWLLDQPRDLHLYTSENISKCLLPFPSQRVQYTLHTLLSYICIRRMAARFQRADQLLTIVR